MTNTKIRDAGSVYQEFQYPVIPEKYYALSKNQRALVTYNYITVIKECCYAYIILSMTVRFFY